jgi:transposase InsO family protein
MPWEAVTVNHIRHEFIQAVQAGDQSKSALCREYGISRPTGYKWLKRYADGEGLSDRSCAPFHSPHKTSATAEQKILAVRAAHPAWGPRKIRRVLVNEGETSLPAPSTMSAILKRNGCVSEKSSQNATPYKRFQRETPNELWQCDFKGHFALQDGSRCHPLTVLDDHSRFNLCLDAKPNEQAQGVIDSFLRLFRTYGLPQSILCDNGPPWGSPKHFGHTALEALFMDYDILPMHGQPNHPQTQGKDERFHGTLVRELLSQGQTLDLAHAQERFDGFRECYNTVRPHDALDLDTPESRYSPSERTMPDQVRAWVYPANAIVRKIHKGFVQYKDCRIYVSEGLEKREVGLMPSDVPELTMVCYRGFRVGLLDLNKRLFVRERIKRLTP